MNRFVISDINVKENINHCVGCFGCFVKTPGRCVIADDYQDQGQKFGHCDELVIVSECVFGGYSPLVKAQFDRTLPGLHADFEVIHGEMHHAPRYENRPVLKVYFYGDVTEAERKTAEKLAFGNLKNFSCSSYEVNFCKNAEEAAAMAGLTKEEL